MDAPADSRVISRRTAFTGGMWSAAATVLPMGSTLALSVVITHVLGASALGEQSLVAYVASMMVSVGIYSFTVASVQLLADAGGTGDTTRLAHLLRWSFWAHVAGGTVAATALTVIGLSRSGLHVLWLLAAATALVDALGWAFAARTIAVQGWGPTSARRLVAQAAGPLLGVAAIYAGLGVEGLFAAQLLVSLVLLAFLIKLTRTLDSPSWRGLDPVPWRPVLRLWAMVALSQVISQVVERRIELVFLDRYHDAVSVAMFSVAFNVVGIPIMIVVTVVGAAMPAIAARHTQDPDLVVRTVGRAARIVVALGLVLVAGTVSVGPTLVTSVYGAEFAVAADLVRWLALTLLIAPLGTLCTALWTGTGRLRPVLVAGIAAAVIDLGLAWLLVPPMGTTGAVIATVSAQSALALLILVHTYRSGLRLGLRLRRVARTATVALVAAAATVGIDAVTEGWVAVGATVLVFGLTVTVGVRLLGLVDADDVDWLARTLPARAGRLLQTVSPRR